MDLDVIGFPSLVCNFWCLAPLMHWYQCRTQHTGCSEDSGHFLDLCWAVYLSPELPASSIASVLPEGPDSSVSLWNWYCKPRSSAWLEAWDPPLALVACPGTSACFLYTWVPKSWGLDCHRCLSPLEPSRMPAASMGLLNSVGGLSSGNLGLSHRARLQGTTTSQFLVSLWLLPAGRWMKPWPQLQDAALILCPRIPGADLQLGATGAWASDLLLLESWPQSSHLCYV